MGRPEPGSGTGVGVAWLAAGLLSLLANAVLTPLLNSNGDVVTTAASDLFVLRMAVSASAALLLLIGLILIPRSVVPRSYLVACIGTTTLFAHEWGQIGFVHPLASTAPAGLAALEDQPGLWNLFDLEALVAISLFSLGWMAITVEWLWTRAIPALGPGLIIAGFLMIPVGAALLPGVAGILLGNALLSAGWAMTGLHLAALHRSVPPAVREPQS